jgi:uncharacterized protein (TIGR03435 family)
MNRIALTLLAGLVAWAQEPAPPAFDVASIRAADGNGTSLTVVPGSLTIRNMNLDTCIAWAYRVQKFQVSGPGWLGETSFDFTAKAGTPANENELRRMMQSLLVERFRLVLHRESKEMQALALTVGRNGHKLKPNDVEGSPSFKTGKLNLRGDGATLDQLTEFLAKELRQPVVDQTGLTGRFNYFLDINAYITDEIRKSEGPNGAPPPDAPSIIAQAMQAQLGLKVESKKMPIEILVVDHIEKAPTGN